MSPAYELDPAFVLDLLTCQKWTFAKTMKWCPHEWTTTKTWTEEIELWHAVLRWMFDPARSTVEPWGEGRWRRNVRYYRAGGFRFWTMDDHQLHKCTLMNRAKEP